jgi:hypothetical protein
MRISVEKGLGRKNHPWCAKAALDRKMVDEGALQRMELAVFAQSFYGQNFPVPDFDGEGQTGGNGLSIQQNGAGAAVPDAAPFLGSGQTEVFPEDM